MELSKNDFDNIYGPLHMAFLPENLPPLNKDPNESSEDESPMDNPHHFRKGIMDHQLN